MTRTQFKPGFSSPNSNDQEQVSVIAVSTAQTVPVGLGITFPTLYSSVLVLFCLFPVTAHIL